MKSKKIVKLINDERLNSKAISGKGCDESSTDHCYSFDDGDCTNHSIDICAIKDWESCDFYSQDVCLKASDINPCNYYQEDYT